MDRARAYVGITLVGIVVGQMILKVAVNRRGPIPSGARAVVGYPARALTDPLVVLSLGSAFVAALAWIAATSRLPLSVAYPFMSLVLVLTTVVSTLGLGEQVSLVRWDGIVFVVLGLACVARG